MRRWFKSLVDKMVPPPLAAIEGKEVTAVAIHHNGQWVWFDRRKADAPKTQAGL